MEKKLIYNCKRIRDLKDLLNQSAKKYSDKPAFYLKDSTGEYYNLSYNTYKEHVDALGTCLCKNGYKNKKIAILSENRYEWCLSYMAITCGSAIVVPLDKELQESEIQNLINRSKTSLLIVSKKYLDVALDIQTKENNKFDILCMDKNREVDNVYNWINNGKKLLIDNDTTFTDAIIDNDAMNFLLFTSGTTDLAKGVMLSHRNLCSNIMAVCASLYIDETDRSISILPIHHTYECTCGFLVMLYSGCTIGFNEGLKYISKNMQEIKPTLVMMVPLILESLYKKVIASADKKFFSKIMLKFFSPICLFLYDHLNFNLGRFIFSKVHDTLGGNLRLIISGAAGIDPDVSRGLRSLGFNIRQGYGLTECSPIVTVNGDNDFSDSSIGKPLPYVDVEIVDKNEEGIGEIITRGENVMLGYYENIEATNKVLKGEWFYTGDLGYKDENGFYYIAGRKKNVIVTKNGKNIFPEEVETYINKSTFIKESIVTGKYEENLQESYVHATIVPDFEEIENSLSVSKIDSKKIHLLLSDEIKKINQVMPLYKRIKSFTIQNEELEKTTTKKIKRHNN